MRSLIIAFAMLVPVFFIIAVSGKIKPAPDVYQNPKKAAKISSKIKPLPTADDHVPAFIKRGSIEEEKWKLKRRLGELNDMTPQQWKEKKTDRIKFNKKWSSLPREQRLKAIDKLQEKRKRAPAIELPKAKPEGELSKNAK